MSCYSLSYIVTCEKFTASFLSSPAEEFIFGNKIYEGTYQCVVSSNTKATRLITIFAVHDKPTGSTFVRYIWDV